MNAIESVNGTVIGKVPHCGQIHEYGTGICLHIIHAESWQDVRALAAEWFERWREAYPKGVELREFSAEVEA